MAFDVELAGRVRAYLLHKRHTNMEERAMFRGLTFMVDGKMCISVSGNNLMCRFDPAVHPEVSRKKGFAPMVMKGKTLPGYSYVHAEGFCSTPDFEYWLNLCLDFNPKAKASTKKQPSVNKQRISR